MKNYWMNKKNTKIKDIKTKGCDLSEIEFLLTTGAIYKCWVDKEKTLNISRQDWSDSSIPFEFIDAEFDLVEEKARQMFGSKLGD
jgi:hypothetical protein